MATIITCAPPTATESLSGEQDGGYEQDETSVLVTNISIEYLKTLYSGSSQLITQDFAIEGIITANDAYGEFPTSMVVEDSSGAIEIMCDFDCAISGFIFGSTLKVLCSGLWIGSSSGMLSLGGAPEGQSATSQIPEEQMAQYLQLSDVEPIIPIPTTVTISTLSANHILRYVELSNLTLQSSITTFCTRNAETSLTEYTSHTLQDLYGNTITLAVDRNVIYADDNIPSGIFSVKGIVEYFAGEYQLRITNCEY